MRPALETAVIENSPYVNFCQDEWESIVRFSTDKEHLRKNIANVIYCQFTTKRLENGLFLHNIGLEISVRTASLWESPRSYLLKHLGKDTWERGNSSSITLKKIHQK